MFSFSLGIYPGVELLHNMTTRCLIILGTAGLFPKVATLFYIPTRSILGFQYFLHLCQYLMSDFFGSSHPSGYEVSHCDLHFSGD